MPPPSPAEIVATTTTSTTGTTATTSAATTGTMGSMVATTTVATATVTPATTSTAKPPAVAAIKQPKPATTTAPPPSTAVTIKPAKPAASRATVITPNTTRIERNATGAATMTNSGQALPKVQAKNDDAMRSHYDEMAQSFASQATGSYTVQFELVCQTSSLTKAVQAGGSNVWFVPIAYKGQGCYRVFWGHFASKAEAERGMTEVPASLRAGSKPSVVSVPKK